MTTRTRTTRSNRPPERVQRVADVYLEVAAFLRKLANAYQERARYYREGSLDIGYSNLPPDAGPHMRHPAQRAIDALSPYDVTGMYERAHKALQDIR